MSKRRLLAGLLVVAVYAFQMLVYPITAHAQVKTPAGDPYGFKTPYFKPGDRTSCSNTPTTGEGLAPGSDVYMLGDSITVRTAPAYTAAFTQKQMKLTISGVGGRSWTGAGNTALGVTGTPGTGEEALKTDSDAAQKAKGIIIALGTNGYYQQNNIEAVIGAVRKINPTAKIWWVNVASNIPGVADFNTKLDQSATTNNFTVIPWAKTVDKDGDGSHNPLNILQDGVHPWVGAGAGHPDGTGLLSDLVVKTVAAGTPGTTSDDPQTIIYGYLVGKGLEDFKTAGIMGNMQHESGFNSRRVEGTATPSGDSDSPDSRGYGLVQWTPGSQLIGPAKAAQKGVGDIYFQLDYLWEELQGPEKAAFNELNQAHSIEEATVAFELKFERHAGNPQPSRIDSAKQILEKFKGSSPSTSSGSGSCAKKTSATTQGSFNGYFQFDPQWKDHPYPSTNNTPGTIGRNGCGITSLASVISTLTGDTTVTPISLADYLVSSGMMSTVSSLDPFTKIPEKYGLKTTYYKKADFQKALDAVKASNGSAYIIANVGAGYWTSGGHYFVVRGQDASGMVQVWDVGENSNSHKKTDKTYTVDFMLGSDTNAYNWWVISK